jgi:hypothetical protein
MMEQVGHLLLQVWQQQETDLVVQEHKHLALGFGGATDPANTAATEEWTGAGAPLTVTITAS